MKIFKKLKDIISASILCLRFPFLYPRNRWDGKHHCYVLGSLRYKLQKKSTLDVGVTAKLEREVKERPENWIRFFNIDATFKNDILTLTNGIDTKNLDVKKLIWNYNKMEILGFYITFALTGRPLIHFVVTPIDPEDTTNYGYGCHSLELITNKFIYKLCKFVTWFDIKVLDKILFLPSYTELDAMEPGWRKVFGIQICKEIKKELKKHKFLYKYRISQIKEKGGYLHWYSNGVPKDCNVYDIIHKYAELSYKTCGICGKPATKLSKGWIYPYCDDCIGDKQFTEIEDAQIRQIL